MLKFCTENGLVASYKTQVSYPDPLWIGLFVDDRNSSNSCFMLILRKAFLNFLNQNLVYTQQYLQMTWQHMTE